MSSVADFRHEKQARCCVPNCLTARVISLKGCVLVQSLSLCAYNAQNGASTFNPSDMHNLYLLNAGVSDWQYVKTFHIYI